MSSVFSQKPPALTVDPVAPLRSHRSRYRLDNVRGLATLLLAAGVAGLVVVVERLVGHWADDHLFLAWVALWIVVLAGSALLAAPSRRLARRAWRSAQGWSLALREARAEVRLWQSARADHRATAELVQSSQRDLDEEPSGPAWGRFPERLADGRGTASHLRHP
jgi:hypothetical protein